MHLAANNREASIDAGFERLRYRRYQNTEKAIHQLMQKKGMVLDVGSGPGTGLLAFKDAGWNVLGVEPDPWRASYSKSVNGIEVFCGRLEDAPFEPHSIDAIILSHVLEHVHTPVSFLKVISRLLKPNGLLYIEVPNLKNSVSWTDAFYLEHLNNFSLNNLVQVIEKADYKPMHHWEPQTKPTACKHLGIFAKANVLDEAVRDTKPLDLKPAISLEEVLKAYRKNAPEIINKYDSDAGALFYAVEKITDICSCIRINDLQVQWSRAKADQRYILLKEVSRFDKMLKRVMAFPAKYWSRAKKSLVSAASPMNVEPQFAFPKIHSF